METVKSINTPVSLVREYVIQTSSYRAIALDGSVSAAPILISPDSVVNGKRANAEVSLTATLVGREEDAQVKVEMVVRTGGGVAITFTRTLRAPSVSDIMSVVADSVPEGDIKTKTCLLTIGTDDEAVEVIIM
ncbi:MAG TPA: hypothetical protein DD670_10565 [Planctomycetaceae bacterium]|nr:hypothetical protein [Planctomycetaceae bacterium]